MANNPRRAKGWRRDKLRRRLKMQRRGCWICRAFGRPDYIDYDLPTTAPGAFEVDELVPVSKGGSPFDYSNVDAAHRACNAWRGNRSVAEVLALAAAYRAGEALDARPPVKTTTEW